MSLPCRLRPLTLVSLGLMAGGWHRRAAAGPSAERPDTKDELTPSSSQQRLAQATQSLMNAGLRLQPDAHFPEMEWSVGAAASLGPKTQFTGGYVLESDAETEDWSDSGQELRSNRWQMKTVLGVQHQWDVTPEMKLSVSYERMMGNSFGLSSAVGASPNRVKANLDYRIRPGWQSQVRLEQRVGRQENRMKLNGRLTGELSPTVTTEIRASHDRRTHRDPSTRVRVGISYIPAAVPEVGSRQEARRSSVEPTLETHLNYEYRQRRSSTHLLQAAATYRPNWRWEMGSHFGVRQRDGQTDALLQAGMAHYLPNRLDVGGDVRLLQNIGGGARRPALGATMELGYHINANLRLSAGYAFGETKDRDFRASQPAGPYVGLRLK